MSDAAPFPPSSKMSPYLECVGRISIGVSFFELQLNRAIWHLANVEQHAGACITAQFIGPGPRFRAIQALLGFRGASKELVKTFDNLRQDAESVARERNRFVHDPALMDQEGGFVRFEVTADRKLHFGMEAVTLADFEKLEKKVNDIRVRFDKEFNDALVQLPPFPNLQFGQSEGFEYVTNPPK